MDDLDLSMFNFDSWDNVDEVTGEAILDAHWWKLEGEQWRKVAEGATVGDVLAMARVLGQPVYIWPAVFLPIRMVENVDTTINNVEEPTPDGSDVAGKLESKRRVEPPQLYTRHPPEFVPTLVYGCLSMPWVECETCNTSGKVDEDWCPSCAGGGYVPGSRHSQG